MRAFLTWDMKVRLFFFFEPMKSSLLTLLMADEEELECLHDKGRLPTVNATNGVIDTSAVVVTNGKQ